MNTHIPVINNLRGIAASAVCYFHFVSTTQNYIHNKLIRNIFDFGDHGVYMFFVISGIVIPLSMIKSNYSYKNWGRFVGKRFMRLEPPYICAVIIAIIYFQIRLHIPNTAPYDMMLTKKELLLHLGYLVPFVDGARWAFPSLWTLSIEFQYYLLLSIIFPLFNKRFGRYFAYLLFLIMPLTGIHGGLFPYHATMFLTGIAYALWYTGWIEKKEYLIITSLCFGVSLFVLPVTFLIAVLLTILIVHFAASYHNKYLGFLGAISYSLYLLHQVTGTPVINFLSHYMREPYQKPFVIMIGFAISVASAYVLYKIVELPSLRFSKSIRYGENVPVKSAAIYQQRKNL
ncbi:MAG TPA: acyltransferase [Flavitalea sp.]|nr:acyltransferase [Flavitalea sp.]